jgi:hypothetical protein
MKIQIKLQHKSESVVDIRSKKLNMYAYYNILHRVELLQKL